MVRPGEVEHTDVQFSEDGALRHLHLDSIWIQGSMQRDAPLVLVHPYVQRMMAWLMFVEPASVAGRRAMQLGLGAGSLTKFCARVLRMDTTAIELNPKVVAACRGWFRLPPDGPRMRVVLGDAAEMVRAPQWSGAIDALQVDLYDREAAAPVLDSPGFYADCRRLLTPEGCMTVNLFGRDSSFERSVAHMVQAFGAECIWAFKATREGNTVVLAQRRPGRPARALWMERGAAIEARWGLPAKQWSRVLRPMTP